MKLIVSRLAQLQISQTAGYLKWRNGDESMRKFLSSVRKAKLLLRRHPNIGPTEPLLADRTRSYRSLVVTPYNKFIYTISDDTIEVAAFWDTRRDPSALNDEVK